MWHAAIHQGHAGSRVWLDDHGLAQAEAAKAKEEVEQLRRQALASLPSASGQNMTRQRS